jgi:hypothetical protein
VVIWRRGRDLRSSAVFLWTTWWGNNSGGKAQRRLSAKHAKSDLSWRKRPGPVGADQARDSADPPETPWRSSAATSFNEEQADHEEASNVRWQHSISSGGISFDLSLTEALPSKIVREGAGSLASSPAVAGTFAVRDGVSAVSLLPKTLTIGVVDVGRIADNE